MGQWITDAQLAHDIKEIHLHQNAEIEAFLHRSNQVKTIIVASKGMGKTLVMRHKRELLQKSDDGVLLIPRDAQSDYVNLPSSPSSTLMVSLRESMFWEDLWKSAIIISIFLNAQLELDKARAAVVIETIGKCNLPDDIARRLVQAIKTRSPTYERPSTILNLLLRESKGLVEKYRASGISLIWDLYLDLVHSGCAVFIDSFDQELSDRFNGDLAIWCSGQNGLLKAAWELSRHNRHVKIYVTIRQEAFAKFEEAQRLNILGSVLLIRYTQADLRRIFELSIEAYDGKSSIGEFLGFDRMHNFFLKREEDAFEYIYRHTIGVPRWLMILGENVASLRDTRGVIQDKAEARRHQRQVAQRVNDVAGNELARAYLQSELRLFFDGRDPIAAVSALLKRNQSTVLSMANLRRLSEVYQQRTENALEHPFCLLMNLGLLGHVARTPAAGHKIQTFKRPYEFDWNYVNILPEGEDALFLLHPSLHYLAQASNANFRFMGVRIGDELQWTRRDEKRVKDNKFEVFISHAREDWDGGVAEIVELIESRFNERSAFLDLWIDRYNLKSGEWFLDRMGDAVERADFLIFMVSRRSLASAAVQLEWKTKLLQNTQGRNSTVLPFIIDDTPFADLPAFLRGIQTYRFIDGAETVSRLVDDMIGSRDAD